MKNTLATTDNMPTAREKAHAALSAEIAAQGIVLLENNDVLPLSKTVKTVALFGSGARRTVKGGTGSGDVNVREYTSVEQGLINAGYNVSSASWLDEFDKHIDTARAVYDEKIRTIAQDKGAFAGLVTMMAQPFSAPSFRCLEPGELKKYPADAAVYVLSRNSGEGADRKAEKGDYYLSEQETSDITLLSRHYSKFALLLNTGGVVDLSPVKNLPGMGAVLLIGQGGSEAGDAAAAILSGRETPSGKLTATWAERYEDYPFFSEFASADGDIFDSYYREGIFVGYRYFDSFNAPPAYSFGYGLSYTDFSIDVLSADLSGSEIFLSVTVTNTGNTYSGREVVQLYASAPSGKLYRPYQSLAAFQKTKLLSPGETQTLTLSFPLERLASYDEESAAWLLEAGDYILRCGNSSRNTKAAAILKVSEAVIIEQCKNLLRGEKIDKLSPANTASNIEYGDLIRLSVDRRRITRTVHDYSDELQNSSGESEISFRDVISGEKTPEELAACLRPKELATLCVGAARINLADVTIVGNFSESLPGAAGETASELKKHGIPSITMVDGPAGIRVNPIVHEKDGAYIKNPEEDPIFRHLITDDMEKPDLSGTVTKYQYCTALPVATMLAQSWDMKLLEKAGTIIGREMLELGVSLWLAPGMNIQRNPLCGRNFEYFSEDPLLSGLCAAAVTKGVQSFKGIGVTIKHFAANNQESNRNFNNSLVSERALREIYLKGFEICIKEARPMAVMTALNLINDVHAAGDFELLTAVLRQEWGFDGAVITDWGTTGVPGSNKEQKYDCTYAADCMRAGNDLIMPGSERDLNYIVKELESGKLDISQVRRCAANIIRLLLRTARE